MIEFFLRRVYRTKNHLLYGSIAQIILMGANVLILLSSNFEIPYTIFQSVVPTYFYLFFISLFYLLISKFSRKSTGRSTIFSRILTYTILGANLVYTLITSFLDTVIVQAINAFYMTVYVSVFGTQYAHGGQMNLLRIFSYGASIASILAFYFCFVNMLVAWGFIIITTIMLFATYLIFHENFKRSLPKKKVLRSRCAHSSK